MFLIGLVFASALILEILGSYISVIGLSSKSSIILMILAIALDFSKVVIASVLYKNWKSLNLLFKTFLVPTVCFLIVITSWGAYAFLLQEFGKTTSNQTQITAKIESLTVEKNKLQTRKLEIDKQISDVPIEFISQKRRMNEMFSEELKYGNTRLIELDKEIPALTQEVMKDTNEAGTLGSLAKAWGTTPEQTSKFLAFMMVIVINPLAIVMLMVGNFLQTKREQDIEELRVSKEKKELEESQKRKRIELENELMNEQISDMQEARIKKDKKGINMGAAMGITSNGEVINQEGELVKKDVQKPVEVKKEIVAPIEVQEEIVLPVVEPKTAKKEEVQVSDIKVDVDKKEEKKKALTTAWQTSKPVVLDAVKPKQVENKDDPFAHDGEDLNSMFQEYNKEDTPKVLNKK